MHMISIEMGWNKEVEWFIQNFILGQLQSNTTDINMSISYIFAALLSTGYGLLLAEIAQ
jgi:hypothetical protein